MTDKEYRQHPAVSRSELWKMKDSPEKFRFFKDAVVTSPALIFGQALHKFVLENTDFYNEFAVCPAIDRRTKSGRETYTEFIENANGKTVISEDDMKTIEQMASKLNGNPLICKLLSGKHEQEYFWTDDATGIRCKCRTDCLTEVEGESYIVDLKTCQKADTEHFMRHAIDYGYDFQAAMYKAGVETNIGKSCQFVFIAIEKEPPYSYNVMLADELFITHGYDIFREFIGIYKHCCTTDNWYGYMGMDNDINPLTVPAWIAKDMK